MSTLHGAEPDAVLSAIASGEPFIGGRGFAGQLPDGRIVRDVLGRYPVFVEAGSRTDWAFAPHALESPAIVPAGSVIDGETTHWVWNLPDPTPYPDDATARTAMREAIDMVCARISTDDTAIGFSGGVDSSLLAATIDVPGFAVGFEGASDLSQATSAADRLGRSCETIEVTHADIKRAIPPVARATGRRNGMDMAIGISLYLLAEGVRAAGYERLVLGQGADELFGGYEKIAKPDHRVDAETVADARREVMQSLPDGLARDVLAVRAAGMEPVMPYLDDVVVEAALALREDQLVRRETRKWMLREIAGETLPPAIADRSKSAIQYGNDVATELDRLARQAGYKRRMDRHVERYVDAVCDQSSTS